MSLLFIAGALYKGWRIIMILGNYWPIINIMISCCGIVFIYNQIRALKETPAWYLYAMWYHFKFDTFKPVSRLSSQFVTCFFQLPSWSSYSRARYQSPWMFSSPFCYVEEVSSKTRECWLAGNMERFRRNLRSVGTRNVMALHSWTPVGSQETKPVFESGMVWLR